MQHPKPPSSRYPNQQFPPFAEAHPTSLATSLDSFEIMTIQLPNPWAEHIK